MAVIALGTLLNPLNSSMIAVALVDLEHAFGVGFGTASWLVSGFYLAACVGQPLMGRIADRFGPRRVYVAGLVIVCLAGAAAPFAPGFTVVLLCRIVQAVGTSAAFPAGLSLIRRVAGSAAPPSGALGTIAVANSASAAFGPVLGGFLVAFVGWQGIFLVNVPLTLVTLVLALRVLPADGPAPARTEAGLVRLLDPLGIVLFSGTLISLLAFLLALPDRPLWILLPVTAVAGVLLVLWERRAPTPFLDVRGFVRSPALTGVLGQQAAIQFVFYGVFYGLPLWLEQVRGYPTEQAGLLMLPVAALGVLVTPVAARLVTRFGPRLPLLLGSIGLLAGTLLLLTLDDATSVAGIVAVAAVIGLPNGLNNMGLQAALYTAAPPDATGVAAGLFQTARYVGAILSTALIGLLLSPDLSARGLHRVAVVIAALAVLLVVAAFVTSRRRASTA
ncbi:MFS transporter [Actinocatenispora rupis]|uniref:MFS transporter n=1 Tax=Actinocatenispora rupis TaxID=519421 RepID=A0A8J3JD68_9ACTN|nr:MFS transporter [Actinocatenispora rupis]